MFAEVKTNTLKNIIMTQVNMLTNKTIRTLFNIGLSCKEIRAHYGEVDNSELNNYINIYVTKLRNSKK